MRDNVAAETVLTVHDAEWTKIGNVTTGKKAIRYNWSRDPTCFGATLQASATLTGQTASIHVTGGKKWIKLSDSGKDWLYMLDETDKLRYDDGSNVDVYPGDMIRYIFEESNNFDSKVVYQYRFQRIAFLDAGGDLVKTRAFNAFEQNLSDHASCSPFYCNANKEILNRRQVVELSPQYIER